MTLTLTGCESANPDIDVIMALALAHTLEYGRPYPDVVAPFTIFAGSPDARLIAGMLRRLANGRDRTVPDRTGDGAGPGL